jgi:H+/Cl- antiporter ClcA
MFKFKSSSTTASTASTSTIPTPLKIANLILRFLQLVFAVTVIGLYSTDLDRARRRNVKANSRWVYAVVVGALSALTALLFMIPRVKFYRVFPWDGVLFILWTAVFGIFGKLYINETPAPGDTANRRMKNAVWIDLVNMILWFLTTLLGAALFFKYRKTRSTYTGRATV